MQGTKYLDSRTKQPDSHSSVVIILCYGHRFQLSSRLVERPRTADAGFVAGSRHWWGRASRPDRIGRKASLRSTAAPASMAAALSHQRVAELHKRAQESVDQYPRGAQQGKTAFDGLPVATWPDPAPECCNRAPTGNEWPKRTYPNSPRWHRVTCPGAIPSFFSFQPLSVSNRTVVGLSMGCRESPTSVTIRHR